MKTILSLALTFLISVSSFATVRTVSNDVTRPAQFNGTGNTAFVAAHNASLAGDTIYVYGSPFDYGTLTISKRLVVMGAGYAPNNQFGQPTRVGQISLFRDGSTDPSGSVIIGFFISGSINCTGTLVTNNVTVFRNRINNYIYLYINSTLQATGWTIYNNIVYQVLANASSRTAASATNILIANNIITGSITNINSNTVLIDHNVFLGPTNLYQLWNVIVTNNIFVRASGDIFSSEVVFCTFNKNISLQNTIAPSSTYNPTNLFETTYTSTGGGSNSGSGNLVGTNPLFLNVPNNNTYDATYNYRLQAGSPGKAPFSTDGTDAGIYGGSYPFPSGGTAGSGFDTSPMPPIPQVTVVNIQNATIAPNGTLNVQVQGRVNN
ncbi:MAG TPA: hypothetical protein PLV21_03165 [Cyclobacteriaceae bacterium]|nr:hypothetical protein [Cyclobacteriaceae bacterium]HRJ80857.1 hypothetical protein [Cyclobacteriaceae bacterium]